MRYSLADYAVTIKTNDATLAGVLGNNGTYTIGGSGNPLEQITIDVTEDMWTTESFATGAYIHNQNLSRIGKITIRLSQISEYTDVFKNIVQLHYTGNYNGLTVSVVKINNVDKSVVSTICTGEDCYFTKIPSQEYGKTAGMDDWVLTCGVISYS